MVIIGEANGGLFGTTTTVLFAGLDYEQAVEWARRSASRYASLVMVSAANNAYDRGDFRRGRDFSREAMRGVRMSPYPCGVLAAHFMFLNPKNLATELTAALEILDETGADTYDYAQFHGAVAAIAAAVENVDLARREAAITLEKARHIGNPSLIALGLYALGLSSWQADPAGAQTALEDHIQIALTGRDYLLARVLALLAQLRARGGHLRSAIEALHEGLKQAHIHRDRPAAGVCLARGVVVMATGGELQTAAVFWGAATEGVFASLTVLPPNEIPSHDQFMAKVQSELGNAHDAATARGAAMTYEQITTFALAAVERLWRAEELRQGKNSASSPAVD
jgi:hypothetical protein